MPTIVNTADIPVVFHYTSEVNSPETNLRVLQLADEIVKGVSRQTLKTKYLKKWDIKPERFKDYYNAALKFITPTDMAEYKDGLIQANFERLEKIAEEGMKSNSAVMKATAINAIKEMNKMLGVGDGKMVAVETPDTKFVIKFGE